MSPRTLFPNYRHSSSLVVRWQTLAVFAGTRWTCTASWNQQTTSIMAAVSILDSHFYTTLHVVLWTGQDKCCFCLHVVTWFSLLSWIDPLQHSSSHVDLNIWFCLSFFISRFLLGSLVYLHHPKYGWSGAHGNGAPTLLGSQAWWWVCVRWCIVG